MLAVKKAASFKEKLVVASYGVWQRHGGKKSWSQYKTALGLDDKEDLVDRSEENRDAVKTAFLIHQKIEAGRKRGNKS